MQIKRRLTLIKTQIKFISLLVSKKRTFLIADNYFPFLIADPPAGGLKADSHSP